MGEKNNQLTQGSIGKGLLQFAFPLFLGNLFQQLYNVADSLVVGNYCGKEALAAVSSSGHLCFLLIGFFQGVFLGGSVIISQRFGAKDEEGVDIAIHNTVIFALIFGLLLSVLGVLFTPKILGWMGTPESVIENSITYFRIYCAGLLGLVLYNTTNGIFQAVGNSRYPLYYLIISSVVNVVLDIVFVVHFDMGVAGAAMATVLGQTLSAVLGMLHLMSGRFIVKISLSKLKPRFAVIKRIFLLGFPSGIQNSVIAIANVVVQTNINSFGDIAVAGCGSYTKVEGFLFIPVMCLSMTLTTFISQNLGAEQPERARSGARIGLWMSILSAALFGIFYRHFAGSLLGLFSEDTSVIRFGITQAKVITPFYCLCAISHGVAGVLRGAGKTMTPMMVMLAVWCVFRISYISVMVGIWRDIRVVFSAYPVTWIISSIIFIYFYLKGDWLKARVQKIEK